MSCILAAALKVVALLHLQCNIVHHYVIGLFEVAVTAKVELLVRLHLLQTKSKARTYLYCFALAFVVHMDSSVPFVVGMDSFVVESQEELVEEFRQFRKGSASSSRFDVHCRLAPTLHAR